jgi:hypothetical protein
MEGPFLHLVLLTNEARRGYKGTSVDGVRTALVRVSMIQEVRRSGERFTMKTHSSPIPRALRPLASRRWWTVESFLLRSLGDHTVTTVLVLTASSATANPRFVRRPASRKVGPNSSRFLLFLLYTMYKT